MATDTLREAAVVGDRQASRRLTAGLPVAVAVHRATRSLAALVLAVFAVVGGVLAATAGPLVVLTGDPRLSVLLPLQAGLAVWLVGTGILLFRRAV